MAKKALMKILFFATYFYPYLSGLTTYPAKVFSFLAEKHQVTVLTFKHQQKLKLQEIWQGLQIKRMKFWFKLSKGFISPQSWWCFWQELQQTQVVFLNIPNAEGLPLALLAKLLGKKVISIFHCQVFLGSGLGQRLIAALLNLSVFGQLFLSDQIIIYTQDYFHSLLVGRWFKRKAQVVLPPVAKLAVARSFAQQLKKQKGQQIWIGFAGRVAREKGLEYLGRAVAKLQQDLKFNQTIKLVVAGPFGQDVVGEADYYQRIKELLKQMQVEHQFLGSLHGAQLGAFYQAIDLLVLPSINQTEAFGMVQVEAMLAGKPVVASDLPGVRQPVKLTGMGLVVKPKEAVDLAKAIAKVLRQPQKFVNQQTKTKVKKLFSLKKTYRFYQQLLQKLATAS
ncbi:MAG: glycosyltransferase [Candidatus Pacebacteria bacterium]|nr:glycosyltransferase [Candidatus Paceibacterota bacterium]